MKTTDDGNSNGTRTQERRKVLIGGEREKGTDWDGRKSKVNSCKTARTKTSTVKNGQGEFKPEQLKRESPLRGREGHQGKSWGG